MVLYTFYQIVCNDLDVKYRYVGSTQNFTRRKHQHKRICETSNLKIYQVIRENGGWSNWSMIKIEDAECETKLDAGKRERELLEQLGNGMNTQIPGRTIQEWYEDNKGHLAEQQKQYRQKNKEQIAEYHKQYRQENKEQIAEYSNKKYECECGGKYTHAHKSRHLKSKKHQDYIHHAAN